MSQLWGVVYSHIFRFLVQIQSSGAVRQSRWTPWAPVPNKPTVPVDLKHHFNQLYPPEPVPTRPEPAPTRPEPVPIRPEPVSTRPEPIPTRAISAGNADEVRWQLDGGWSRREIGVGPCEGRGPAGVGLAPFRHHQVCACSVRTLQHISSLPYV